MLSSTFAGGLACRYLGSRNDQPHNVRLQIAESTEKTNRYPVTARLNVFLSSTCYDLLDARAQLSARLERAGFIVRASDNFESSFALDPMQNSIESCKRNVEASDVVVCIIDRRYGPPLPAPYGPKSATHVEVDHARLLEKPVFYFIRDRAYAEFDQLQRNQSFESRWVESEDPTSRKSWVHFVKCVASLQQAANYSNWLDQFTTVVDLCDKVESRLLAAFPQHAVSRALEPERFVRLIFIPRNLVRFQNCVSGRFRNEAGPAAFKVRTGWRMGNIDHSVHSAGALAPGADLVREDGFDFDYEVPCTRNGEFRSIFCEYENIYGDCYRVERTIAVEELEVDLPQVIDERTAHTRIPRATQLFLLVKEDRVFVQTGVAGQRVWLRLLQNVDAPVSPPPP